MIGEKLVIASGIVSKVTKPYNIEGTDFTNWLEKLGIELFDIIPHQG